MAALRRCGVCSAGLGPAMETCVRCGAPASMAGPPPAPAPTVILTTARAEHHETRADEDVCASCGARLTAGTAWCGRCLEPIKARVAVGAAGTTGAAGASTRGAVMPVMPVVPSAAVAGVAPKLDLGGRDHTNRGHYGYGVDRDDRPLEYAHWAQRVAASLIDNAMLWGILAAAFGIFGTTLTPPVFIPVGLVMLCFWWWNKLTRQGFLGQSLGKSMMGIKLVREHTGRPIGTWNCLWRGYVHRVDFLLLIGYLWPLWDEKHQTFTDKIMKTVVIKTRV